MMFPGCVFATARLDEQRLLLRPKPDPKWYRPDSHATAAMGLGRHLSCALRAVHLGPSTGPGHSTVVHIQQRAITSDLCIKSCKVQSSLMGIHQNDTILLTLHYPYTILTLTSTGEPTLAYACSSPRKKSQAWHGEI